MEFKENGLYLNAQGEILYAETVEYSSKGYYYDMYSSTPYDLIASVPEELHYEICRMIKEYHTNKEFKYNIDKNFEQNTKGKQNV